MNTGLIPAGLPAYFAYASCHSVSIHPPMTPWLLLRSQFLSAHARSPAGLGPGYGSRPSPALTREITPPTPRDRTSWSHAPPLAVRLPRFPRRPPPPPPHPATPRRSRRRRADVPHADGLH